MMNSEVFGASNVVPSEGLVTMPTVLDRVIENVTHRLVDRVMCELEKGESICSLQSVEQNQFSDICSVEIRRTVKITRLVRCCECEFWDRDWTPTEMRDYVMEWHYCPMIDKNSRSDWFCADAERKV